MNSNGDILDTLPILDVREDEGVTPRHGGVEAEDAFLCLALAEDHLVLRVHDKEVNELVSCATLANEECTPDVLRSLFLDIFVEGLYKEHARYAHYKQGI